MSFFSSPPSKAAEPEPQPDPAQTAARAAREAQLNTDRSTTAEQAKRRLAGRTMGTAGANSTYTDSAAGFGRSMGSANI